MEDQTDAPEFEGFDRRRFIAASGGAIGFGALAGCVEDDEEESEEESSDAVHTVSSRPQLPSDPAGLSQPDRHIVELLEYQTDLIEEIHEEVTG